jgi:hypothetical protein
MPEKPEPTYDELRAIRSEEWETAQKTAAKTLADFHALLAGMPDVKDAPATGVPWSHPEIMCPCGETVFHVERWVTVNGVRHRTELTCTRCARVDTWDWTLKMWLPWTTPAQVREV